MVRKWLVSGVHFGAGVGDVRKKKVTAEPILSLDTSPMVSGQHLCSPPALSSLFGEDSEAVLLDAAQEPGATVYTHTQRCVSIILIFTSFPLPPCPDIPYLLVDLISSLANCIINISIVFLMFPFPYAFGNLSIIPGLPMFPFSVAATALDFYKSSLQLPSSCIVQLRRCEQLLIPPFPPSWTIIALRQGCCFLCTSAYSTWLWTAFSALLWTAFSALHIKIEDMKMIYFCCSDIIRDMIWQGIYRQVLMTILNQMARFHLPPYPLYWLVHHSQCRQLLHFFSVSSAGKSFCPSFMFWGSKALPLVPQSFLSESHIFHSVMQLPSKNLTLSLIISHLCCSNIHFPD